MRYMRQFQIRRVLTLTVLAASLAGTPAELLAQGEPAQRSVVCFEEAVKARLSGGDVLCPEGVAPPLDIIMTPMEYPDQMVEGLLDGLARLAVSSDSRIVRSEAIAWLAFPGLAGATAEPRRGVVGRLARVYQESKDRLGPQKAYHNRSYVVALVGKQAERIEAATFLEQVARANADPASDEHQLSSEAIRALGELGSPGNDALRRLGQNEQVE